MLIRRARDKGPHNELVQNHTKRLLIAAKISDTLKEIVVAESNGRVLKFASDRPLLDSNEFWHRQFNGVIEICLRRTLVAMATKIGNINTKLTITSLI